MTKQTYVIAEAGSCHDGEACKAVALIDAAANAGANAVKFQFWSDPAALAIRRGSGAAYEAIYARYALPHLWLDPMRQFAKGRGLDFMCSTYLPQDVAVVAPYVSHFKVASFEAEAVDLLRAHVPHLADGSKWVIVSLGMGASEGQAQEVFRPHHLQVKYLHCVSAYPAPLDQMNLLRIKTSQSARRFAGLQFAGFSDHTDPGETWTGALAVAAGAEIVEAHLRLPTTFRDNPDAPHAMDPQQFVRYVEHIRQASRSMGTGEPVAQPSEAAMSAYRVTR